jgi:hypothetical protein
LGEASTCSTDHAFGDRAPAAGKLSALLPSSLTSYDLGAAAMSSSTSSSAASSPFSLSETGSESASSQSERSPSPQPRLGKRKRAIIAQPATEAPLETINDDIPVLSHAERRRQKKKQKAGAVEKPSMNTTATVSSELSGDVKLRDVKSDPLPKRQNSVWVGNLSFKTTEDALKSFFDGVGEITRIHMPTKAPVPGQRGPGVRKENRG